MPRYPIGIVLLAVLYSSGVFALRSGVYGLTVFVVHPLLLGALVAWTFPPASGWQAVSRGVGAVAAASALLFLLGFEGAGCILIALPLTLPLGAAGAWVQYRFLCSRRSRRGAVVMLLMVPPSTLTFDTHARPPVYTATTSIEIAAPPERVWDRIIHLSTIETPHEWYFRAGLAYPTQARIEGSGPGAMRYCGFSTGPVIEKIDVWDAPRRLRFQVLENPAPMREWTPYAEVSPKHLHGYLIFHQGEFRLTRLPGNRTLLEGTSWYQHGIWPAEYWRLWTDAVVHRIHRRVFEQIKTLAEHDDHD